MNSWNLGLPSEDLGLFTDLYELTMAQTFYGEGMAAPATFSLFVRSYPPDRGYLVAAGLADVLDYLEALSFSASSLSYLHSTGLFTKGFLDFLGGLRFTGSVRAIPEGRLFFVDEPILEVTGPIIEAQLVETLIINQINLQSLLATKGARCQWAAPAKALSDFASRRTHGTDAALKVARATYLAGFQTTSNVLAAQRYGIPPAGTMAHSFVSSFPSEIEAFRAYARAFPARAILLLDTYDTIEGAEKAIVVAKEMEASGQHLFGVRLDSGDYLDLSRQVRRMLDAAALEYVKIVASGGLDEYELDRLEQAGAPIDIYGVGTRVGTLADTPYSDIAYKLVSYAEAPVMKLSEGKVYRPGAKQVFRVQDSGGRFAQDILGLADEALPSGEPVLEVVMNQGKRTSPSPSLAETKDRFREDFARLDDHYKALRRPPRYPVAISPRLEALTQRVHARLEQSYT